MDTTTLARAWSQVGEPGTWWTGPERVELARHTRGSLRDLLGISPLPAEQEPAPALPANVPEDAIQAIDDIVRRSSHLSQAWLEELLQTGLSIGQYVDMVGVVATVVTIDTFHHALLLPLPPLPVAVAGDPTREIPDGAILHESWVPSVPPEAAQGRLKAFYEQVGQPTGSISNILRAMTYVPDAQLAFMSLGFATYMRELSIDRAQVEFIASTVSSFNNCFY